MHRGVRIAVVGCGIAGSCVAVLLKRQGHDVTLFERSPVLRPIGAGVMLQPIGQCVLERMGLLSRVIARSEPIHDLHAIYRNGRTMIKMPFAAAGVGMHAYGVHRGDIFEVLLNEVRHEAIPIVLDVVVEHTETNSEGVTLSSVDGREFPGFDYVVIANGAKCGLRTQHEFSSEDQEYGYAAIWCNVQSTQVREQLLQVVEGTTRLMGILPLGEGRASLFWGLACRDRERCMQQPIEDWKKELIRFYPAAEETISSIQDWSGAVYGTYRRAYVRPVFDARHVFLGDAAHANSPHLGQGLNFALLDAFRFATSLEQSPSWEEAGRRFVAERRHHSRYYRLVTSMLTPFFQSDSHWRSYFRDCTLPWLHRTPLVRQQMALTMTGLKSGFFGGKMKWA